MVTASKRLGDLLSGEMDIVDELFWVSLCFYILAGVHWPTLNDKSKFVEASVDPPAGLFIVKVQVEYASVWLSVVHDCSMPQGASSSVKYCSEQLAEVGGKTVWPAVIVLGSVMVTLRVE